MERRWIFATGLRWRYASAMDRSAFLHGRGYCIFDRSNDTPGLHRRDGRASNERISQPTTNRPLVESYKFRHVGHQWHVWWLVNHGKQKMRQTGIASALLVVL